MTHLNNKIKSKTKSETRNLPVPQDNKHDSDTDLYIDARLLVQRVNSLVAHVSNLGGAEEAEKNSRETSAHIKNIKEIMALNENLRQVQEQGKHSYTPEEEQALAEELADIIIKNGGFP